MKSNKTQNQVTQLTTNLKINFMIFTIGLTLVLFHCGKSEEKEPAMDKKTATYDSYTAAESLDAPSPESGKIISGSSSSPASKDWIQEQKSENKLGGLFLPLPTNQARLLEYEVILLYECNDLIQTRKTLIELIQKYGYLESSSAYNADDPSMSVQVKVNASMLYDALLAFDSLGNLTSENISTIDHTENQVWQNRKNTREALRLKRKNLAGASVSTESRNWEAIDNSITASEDAKDLAEQEIWKIQDRVKWAKVNITFSTPKAKDKIIIPTYQNALVGILNAFLSLTYYLLWIAPFLLFIGGIGFGVYKGYKKLRA